ncbi:hypothetical protein Rhe02_89710 [Rhizocola hellebori]|uniref:Uncharacterized protein n=1 Tax=Rhizocola hellebori TaxID=1392758 RepID=A0A8J3QGX8_9ACTN|nr:hypothetical protein [Rhizocola hellebori]GIH10904.1 hypothetical protein Rhe02_89710 [Rhizocola hellebori]
MMHYATYLTDPALAAPMRLQLAGQWDMALNILGDYSADLRAEITADRFMWQLGSIDMGVINAASPATATLLTARISYWHKLFELEGGPDVDEAAVYAATPGGWAAFWHAVVQDNVHKNSELAKAEFARARELCADDPFLESYVVRHQGYYLLETDREAGLLLLRRSLQLRAALGARPQTAAAQLALASALGDEHPETADLKAIAWATAEELNMPGLKKPATEQ